VDWGGVLGLSASVVGYAVIGLGSLHWLDPNPDPSLPLAFKIARLFDMPIEAIFQDA